MLRVSCVSRLSRVRGDLRDFLLFPNDLQPQKNNQPTNQAAGGIRYVPIFFPLQLTQPLSSSWWLNQPSWKILIRQKWESIFPNFRAEHSKKYLSCHHPVLFIRLTYPLFFWLGTFDGTHPPTSQKSNPIQPTEPTEVQIVVFRCFPQLVQIHRRFRFGLRDLDLGYRVLVIFVRAEQRDGFFFNKKTRPMYGLNPSPIHHNGSSGVVSGLELLDKTCGRSQFENGRRLSWAFVRRPKQNQMGNVTTEK